MISIIKHLISPVVKEEVRKQLYGRSIPYSQAKKEIASFILQKKKKGRRELGALEISRELNLPVNQTSTILNDFERKGGLRPVDN